MIAAVIAEGDPARVRARIAELSALWPQEDLMVELRLDLMDEPEEGLIKEIPYPVIVTCRRKSDHGGFEGSEETECQASFRILEGLRHGLDHLFARKGVALHGEVLADHVSGPGSGAFTRVSSCSTLRVHHRELAPLLRPTLRPRIRIVSQDAGHDLFGTFALLEVRQSLWPVAHIDHRLSGHRANT